MPRQTLIDHGRLLETLGFEAELVAERAHAVPPDLPVRTCPGWTVSEVVRHLGSVYRAAVVWLVEGRRPRDWQRDPAPGQPLDSYLREGLAELTGVLGRRGPECPAATWCPGDRTYGFWCRRMAHETTVHRVDVEEACGVERSGIAADLAADGVDEALSVWFHHKLPVLGLSGTRGGSVAVRAGGHTWATRAGRGDIAAWRCSDAETADAAAVVSGPAEAVYRWLWGRARPGAVSVDGDEDAAGQLWALLRLATR